MTPRRLRRQQVDASGERPVALHETGILGHQEAEAASAKNAIVTEPLAAVKAKVAEQAEVEHRLRCGALAEE